MNLFRMAPVSGTIVVTVPESVNVIILPSTILFVEDIGSSRSSRRGREGSPEGSPEGREERFILVVGPTQGVAPWLAWSVCVKQEHNRRPTNAKPS